MTGTGTLRPLCLRKLSIDIEISPNTLEI